MNNLLIRVKPEKLPENLKAFRCASGLSQAKAAELMGFSSTSTISHYENGKRKIPIDLLPKFAVAYGIEFELVFRR